MTKAVRRSLGVAGAIVVTVAVIVVAAGGVAIWADSNSSGGYITSGSHTFDSSSRAIVSDTVDVGSDFPDWLIGHARVKATSTNGKAVFVGVGRKADVDAYLAGVARSEISNLDYSPFRLDYTQRGGTTAPASPESRSFWVKSVNGTGTQQLSWRLRSGDWRVVLMNADASPGVTADVTVGGGIGHALAIGLGVIGVGLLIAFVGVGALLAAARRPVAVPLAA